MFSFVFAFIEENNYPCPFIWLPKKNKTNPNYKIEINNMNS